MSHKIFFKFSIALIIGVSFSTLLFAQNKFNKGIIKQPIFIDSLLFTNYWTNNPIINDHYNELKNREDYAVIEYYFDVLDNGKLIPMKNRDSVFIKDFVKYRWKNLKKNRSHDYKRNIKLTMSFLPMKNRIKVEIEILSEFDLHKHILKYKKLYNKEIQMK